MSFLQHIHDTMRLEDYRRFGPKLISKLIILANAGGSGDAKFVSGWRFNLHQNRIAVFRDGRVILTDKGIRLIDEHIERNKHNNHKVDQIEVKPTCTERNKERRERMATQIIGHMIKAPGYALHTHSDLAKAALEHADALIAQLDKS